jgi:hypothetical protein
MPRVGFEPTTAVFQRAKTVHASDREKSVIGRDKGQMLCFRTLSISCLFFKTQRFGDWILSAFR